jgi:hypothetical protein
MLSRKLRNKIYMLFLGGLMFKIKHELIKRDKVISTPTYKRFSTNIKDKGQQIRFPRESRVTVCLPASIPGSYVTHNELCPGFRLTGCTRLR